MTNEVTRHPRDASRPSPERHRRATFSLRFVVAVTFGISVACLAVAVWTDRAEQPLWILGMQTQQIYAASVIAASLCLTVASWMTPGDGAMWVAIPLRILSVLTAAAVVPLCLLWLSLARLATLDVPECASTILYSDDRFSHSDGHVSFYAPSGIWRGERIAYAHTKSRDIIPNGMYLYSVQPDGVSLAYATDSIFIPVPCE